MGEQENNEIKILIDALKYTSNIIVDLTNKLTLQEEKISQLETKLIKTQKLSMENNLKLKSIDIDKLNKILSSSKKYNLNNDNYNNDNDNESDKMSKYIIEKKKNSHEYISQYNTQNKLSGIAGDKTKIDKLIGSIVKRKNDLNQLINDNKENDIVGEYEYTKNNKQNKQNKQNNENSGLDFTIKTATNKSNFDESKTNYERSGMGSGIGSGINNEKEEENITMAQNNDLNKANNILKQIRRRANIKRM
jgi:hypothetical protein